MKKRNRIWKAAAATAIVAAAVCLLAKAPPLSQGIRQGLSVSAGVLIPSLFPFMVLSGFVSLTDYGKIISRPFGLLTEKLLKLPRDLGYVVLLSMVGGYPVGAKTISGLLEQRRISVKTAERMLCFCVSAGPSFLITAVGAGMFLDRGAGLILFATQTAATLTVGILCSLRAKVPPNSGEKKLGMPPVPAFVLSVTGASNAMIILCAFAVLFSGLLELLTAAGLPAGIAGLLSIPQIYPEAVLAGALEVTSGCLAAARQGGAAGFALASVFLSLGGVSVLFQVLSFFRDTGLRIRKFLKWRLLHCALSTAMAVPLYQRFCSVRPAWAVLHPPRMIADDRTALISICLLGMCIALTLSMRKGKVFS